MNHYPRHVGDWMTATAHLTEIEECIYSRMVDQYYAREAPLPISVDAVARLVRASNATAKKAVRTILHEFFTLGTDGWRQSRCDNEIKDYREKAAKASASASTRWSKRNANAYANASPNAHANASETHCVGNANQNQNQNQNQKPQGIGRSECPTPEAPPLPGTLSPATWTAWRAHLANLGKPLTPQAERLQIARLAEHPDAEATVRKAIERGHRNLEPIGGYADAKAKTNVHEKRAATAAAMGIKQPQEKNHVEPTDITGEARRIA